MKETGLVYDASLLTDLLLNMWSAASSSKATWVTSMIVSFAATALQHRYLQ